MIANKIAVQLKSLAQPLKKALHTAAQMDADGVQIDARTELPPSELSETGLRQVRKMLADLNLQIGTIAFPTRRGYCNPDQLDRRIEATRAAAQLASRLNVRTLCIQLGTIPEEDDPRRATLIDALESLTRDGEKYGVMLAARAPAAQQERLALLLESFSPATLGVDLNPAEMILEGATPQQAVDVAGERIVHVHANDAVRGFGGELGSRVPLGRGTADIPAILGQLEEHNYRGWITIERRDSDQPIEDCANAVKFLRAV